MPAAPPIACLPVSRQRLSPRARWGQAWFGTLLLSLLIDRPLALSLSLASAFSLGAALSLVAPVAAAESLQIQLEGLELPLSLDQLEAWSRRPMLSAGRPGADPLRPAQRSPGELDVWLDLLDPASQASLRRLLQAPLLRDRSFGSQLLDSWAGGQLLDEVGDLLTTADGRSTTAMLQATLRQQLLQRRQVTLLSLLRGLPEQRLNLRLDSLVALAEQWRQQIHQQRLALLALQQLDLPRIPGRTPYLGDLPAAPQQLLLPVAHRRQPLPLDLWPARAPEASHHPWLLVLPGLGGNADQLGWFAAAMAQWGWSVAVIQHPGSDGPALKAALEGRGSTPGASSLPERLQDVAAVLEAQRRGQLALPGKGVVLVGHSLGGLTALLAAGLRPAPGLAGRCRQAIDRLPVANPSRLLQCELANSGVPAPFPRNRDLRAVVLFNGFGSLLWPQWAGSTRPLQLPVLMTGGSLDLVTPPLEEQLQLFLPAGDPRSRLVLVEGGSHFSPVRMEAKEEAVLRLGQDLVGADPVAVQNLLLGISGAFLQSLESSSLLPAQERSQQGVRAYVLDGPLARRWHELLLR